MFWFLVYLLFRVATINAPFELCFKYHTNNNILHSYSGFIFSIRVEKR